MVTIPPLVFIPDDDEPLSAAAIACEPPNESPESPVVDMVLTARRAILRLITCEQVRACLSPYVAVNYRSIVQQARLTLFSPWAERRSCAS